MEKGWFLKRYEQNTSICRVSIWMYVYRNNVLYSADIEKIEMFVGVNSYGLCSKTYVGVIVLLLFVCLFVFLCFVSWFCFVVVVFVLFVF